MPTTWYSAEVVDIEEMNQHVRRYFLQPEANFPVFKPGQFITLDLPVSDKRQQRWKSYSIANAPQPGGLIELCIVRHPEGSGTGYMFNEVHKGSKLVFKGPDGGFVLPQNLENLHLVMVCTGTGVAPFRSMISNVIEQGLPYKHIHLIFGGRKEEDILYRKEFELWRDQLPGFSYDVSLSRDPSWPGYTGYVHQIYREQYAEVKPDVVFYLCGWTRMIDEAVAHLVSEMGYAPNQVRYELYG